VPASSQALADIRAPVDVDFDAALSHSISSDSVAVSPTSLFETTPTGLLSGQEWVAELAAERLAPSEPVSPLSSGFDTAVIQLPPAPSSTALFFSAMLSLGAWQLARSSRDLHLGPMPEWYHSGGPAQIGHTTIFDFEYSAVALCVFDEPIPAPVLSQWLARESRPRVLDQHILSKADPRGPPLLVPSPV
jgi:hypothetical protein